MPVEFLQVVEEEGEDPIELPTEEDGTLLLTTVTAQFPGALGLKYKATPESKTFRGVRLSEGVLHPPPDGGWDSKLFVCSFPKENKRKGDETEESSSSKTKRLETKVTCNDLIVLGLPWKTTESDLKDYFAKFGELLVAQVKKDKEGRSRGYGFIRFAQYESQMRVTAQRHMIDGRWCDVKIPSSKDGVVQQPPRRVFVGRCTEDILEEDIRGYFEKFGEIIEVFMPKPFRAFCFVTFLDPEVAQKVCGEDHIIKGVSVLVCNAIPKVDKQQAYERGSGNRRGQRWEDDNDSGNSRYNSGSSRDNWSHQSGPQGGKMDVSAFGSLMNPALMAAALNQAGWSFMGNMAKQDPDYNGDGPGTNRNGSGRGNSRFEGPYHDDRHQNSSRKFSFYD